MERVTITGDHLRRGRRTSSANCPVALALRESGWSHAKVNSATIVLSPHDPVLLTDLALENWIWRWDTSRPVAPITIELDLERRRARVVEAGWHRVTRAGRPYLR